MSINEVYNMWYVSRRKHTKAYVPMLVKGRERKEKKSGKFWTMKGHPTCVFLGSLFI